MAMVLGLAGGGARGDEASATAASLFKRGVEALRAKEFAAAAAAFQDSYARSAKAATMCNLALTYDRWGAHAAEAIEAYRKCAEDDESGRFRDHALERARQLRAERPATAAPLAEAPANEPRPTLAAPSPTRAAPPTTEATPSTTGATPPTTNTPTMAAPSPATTVDAPTGAAPSPTVARPPSVAAPSAVVAPPPSLAPPTLAAPPPPRETKRSFFRDPAACALTALGVAALGVGVGLTVAGKLDDNRVGSSVDLGDKAALYDRAGVLAPSGYVLAGVGAALVVAGVVEWAAHGRHLAARAHARRAGWSF